MRITGKQAWQDAADIAFTIGVTVPVVLAVFAFTLWVLSYFPL